MALDKKTLRDFEKTLPNSYGNSDGYFYPK